MTHICVMSSHKPIRIYMGGLILGVNTLYRLFCFFKLFPMVDKGLKLGSHYVAFIAVPLTQCCIRGAKIEFGLSLCCGACVRASKLVNCCAKITLTNYFNTNRKG